MDGAARLSMRILLVGDYPPDPRLGSTKVLVKLQEEFRALGHECDLLLADSIGGFPSNTYLRRALGPMVAFRAVQKQFKTHGRYDVVDVASAEGFWVGKLRGKLLPPTAVISRSNGLEHLNYRRMLADHDAGLLYKPWTRRWQYPLFRLSQVKAAARAADRLILLNEPDRQFAIDNHWKRADQIDLVPHGVSARFIDDSPTGEESRGDGILFCSTWAGMKGVSYLSEAFARLVRAGRRWNLTVIGGGMPDAAIRADFPPVARPFVTIMGRAQEAELMAAYRTHDLMVLPSTYEGFGMVVIEAMSQRLPVVATPVGCAQAMIASGSTGLLVPPRDAAALADALDRMLIDADLRARCAAGAFDLVRGMTWAKTAELTLDVYRRAIEANARRH
jgi:glycosyltransferase involved in cell wall biosynthesis